MTCTTLELKRKRESLMSTYRLYRKKYQDSIRSGASPSEIFRSSWFAYELMESFLAAVYNILCNAYSLRDIREIWGTQTLCSRPGPGPKDIER
nr:unnamed protein product [Callosobruchus chinensis]